MPISSYKLLILDYGGVYSFEYTADNFNKIILKTFGKLPDNEERLEIIKRSRLLGENRISTKKYVALLGDILAASRLPTIKQFEDATIEVTHPPSETMINLVSRVREAGIRVSLLSDMYMFEVQRTRLWGRYEGFDYVAFSAEKGMTKNNPHFFEQTLKHFHLNAEEALFVDDTLKNIEVARRVGLDVLYADKKVYTRVEQLEKKIYSVLNI